MPTISCGHCGGTHASAAEVRNCFQTNPEVVAANKRAVPVIGEKWVERDKRKQQERNRGG